MKIKIAITDDHPIVTDGLKSVLGKVKHIEIAAIYKTADELLQHITISNPDVLILDMELEDGSDGYQTARKVLKASPQTQILIFSSSDTTFQIKKMLQAGCLGYLLKDAENTTLVQAIESVYRGQRFLTPSLETALLNDIILNKPVGGRRATLTQREKEILSLVVKEHTNQEIAKILFLSLSTVEFHRTAMFQKLGVKNTAGLVREAIQKGLI